MRVCYCVCVCVSRRRMKECISLSQNVGVSPFESSLMPSVCGTHMYIHKVFEACVCVAWTLWRKHLALSLAQVMKVLIYTDTHKYVYVCVYTYM